METLFEFYPYRVYRYTLPLVAVMTVVWLVLLLLSFHVIYLVLALMCAWLTKISYASLPLKILFYQDGFRVCESKRKDTRDFIWEQVKFGYRTNNAKGHRFLVLSPKELTQKQLRQYTNRGANTNRICVDDAVVFSIDNAQYTAELENFILSKVSIVN